MPWWKSTPRHLPLAQGPYIPGCIDIMSGYGADSTFVRLYYPTDVPKDQKRDHSRWFKWIPHEKYIEGFAQLVRGYATVIKMVVWTYGGEPLVPCHWSESPGGPSSLPLIAYSHGFGATRFICATIGAELASHGYLFASIEHKDTSASATYYYEDQNACDNDKKTWIPHTRIQFGPNHYQIRNEQVHRRADEMKKLMDYLQSLNEGSAQNILKTDFDLQTFKGRLDMNNITLMGHSFGGATSLLTLATDPRPRSAVVLDGWMFPVKEEGLKIEKPLLFINTQTFHIEANLKSMDQIVDTPPGASREVYTIKNTTHETHTDTPHVMGYWLDWFKTKLDPVVGTNISNHLTLRFLSRFTGWPVSFDKSEEYLNEHQSVILKGTHLFLKKPKLSAKI